MASKKAKTKKVVRVKLPKDKVAALKSGKKVAKTSKTAAKTAKAAPKSKVKARAGRVPFTSLFSLASSLIPFANTVCDGIEKVKNLVRQPDHKDYVAWAIPGTTGTFKRVGGLWVHGGVLCVQIRWMTAEVLAKAKKLGLTVYGTQKADLKCNRVHVTDAKSAKAVVDLLNMQSKAIEEGTTGSTNLNT